MTSMTTLKSARCGASLLLVVALWRQPALAQASETVAHPRRTSSPYKRPTLDDRVAVLSKNLELTEAQRSAVKKILEQRQQQTVRIRELEAPGNVRIEQFRALQERTVAQIRAVLTDEQKKKYDPLLPRTRPAPSAPQRSVEDWIKATTPH
jgi:Spy/CpxP family protein refolding chaperone